MTKHYSVIKKGQLMTVKKRILSSVPSLQVVNHFNKATIEPEHDVHQLSDYDQEVIAIKMNMINTLKHLKARQSRSVHLTIVKT